MKNKIKIIFENDWMKIATYVIGFTAMACAFSSCKKDIPGCTDPTSNNYNSRATFNDGSCVYSGTVMFWSKDPVDYTDVYIHNSQGTITKYYSFANPECGSSGCTTFELPPGTYQYSAREQGGGSSWDASVQVYANKCVRIKLTK